MSLADTYFKNEVNQILTSGFNDEQYEVRPKCIIVIGLIDFKIER